MSWSCKHTHFPRGGMLIPAVVAEMEQLGLQFGEQCPHAYDSLHVQLPDGWRINRVAGNLFAVYDAQWRARIHLQPLLPHPTTTSGMQTLLVKLVRFYQVWAISLPGPDNSTIFTLELRTGNGYVAIRRVWSIPYPEGSVMYYILEERIQKRFRKWLAGTYPNYDSPFVYWDE